MGAPVDKTQTLPDGTRIHVSGQKDELTRHVLVLVTLPDGQQTELVLTDNGKGGYDLIASMVLGAQMPPSMLATMAGTLSSGGLPVVYNQKAGMGHNGGPPLDDESSNGNNGDPNGKPPLVPPPVTGGASNAKNRTLPSYSTSQLQHEFKHAGDFGVTGNWNKANDEAFQTAIRADPLLSESPGIPKSVGF